MPRLLDLPIELLTQVISCITTKSDLANLRLVNHRANKYTTPIMFAKVTLYAMYWSDEENKPYRHWPLGYDAQVVKNIIESSTLNVLVKHVTIYTCETHCDFHPARIHEESEHSYIDMESAHYDDIWEECVSRIAEFPNLRGITVCFDRHVGGEDSDDPDIYQHRVWRGNMVERIFGVLNTVNQNRPLELAFRNYGGGAHDFAGTLPWLNVLRRLVTLRLSVAHEEYNPKSGSNLLEANPHPFWRSFPELYLKPAAYTLKHLVLYSDLPLGWFPRLDLRQVYFPRLQSLTFGHFIFTYEWQFDWILSHRGTLRFLCLDHCSILYQAGLDITDRLDEEYYPHPGTYGELDQSDWPRYDDELALVSYRIRWHSFFSRCAGELIRLEDFRFGSSKQWDFKTVCRYPGEGGSPLPVMPWEAERDLENEIFEGMYVHYDGWEEWYRSGEWEYKTDQYLDPLWRANLELPPDCKVEDEVGLKLLLRKVGLNTDNISIWQRMEEDDESS